jgi:hypothetical protein
MLNFMRSDYEYDEVGHIILKMRDKSMEQIKHESSILRQDYNWGRAKSKFETKVLQKRDLARNATNF